MSIVMYMSTDQDIIDTDLDEAWGPTDQKYYWKEIIEENLGINDDETIVVIAHGNDNEIGNATEGLVDVSAEIFLPLIAANMNYNAPAKIYISTCGSEGMAMFATKVKSLAEFNAIWKNTEIYGHTEEVSGPVPPPDDDKWWRIH